MDIQDVLREMRERGKRGYPMVSFWCGVIEAEMREKDAEIERLREALNKEHTCLAMELTMTRDHADSMQIKDLEWRRDFLRAALARKDGAA